MTEAESKSAPFDVKSAAIRVGAPAVLALLVIALAVAGLRARESNRPVVAASNPVFPVAANSTTGVSASQLGSASDGATLTITEAATRCGSVSVLESGEALAYAAPAGAQTCAASYTLRHPSGSTRKGTVAFTVSKPSAVITASNPTRTVDANAYVVLNAAQLGASSNRQPLHIVQASTTCGRATATGSSLTYAAPATHGACTLGYTLRDPSGATGAGVATIIVRDRSDAPQVRDVGRR